VKFCRFPSSRVSSQSVCASVAHVGPTRGAEDERAARYAMKRAARAVLGYGPRYSSETEALWVDERPAMSRRHGPQSYERATLRSWVCRFCVRAEGVGGCENRQQAVVEGRARVAGVI
jgi:hypothetical protein